MLMIWFCICIE